jgi:hypothetical protein
MAQDRSLQAAATALQAHFGPRYEASRDEGLQRMAEALQERLGLSQQEAEDAIINLEEARSIRWVETRGPGKAASHGAMFHGVEAINPGAPTGPPSVDSRGALDRGYWELGNA